METSINGCGRGRGGGDAVWVMGEEEERVSQRQWDPTVGCGGGQVGSGDGLQEGRCYGGNVQEGGGRGSSERKTREVEDPVGRLWEEEEGFGGGGRNPMRGVVIWRRSDGRHSGRGAGRREKASREKEKRGRRKNRCRGLGAREEKWCCCGGGIQCGSRIRCGGSGVEDLIWCGCFKGGGSSDLVWADLVWI